MSKIYIVGFGNQAKSWALNLKDSGQEIVIALRKNSQSLPSASKDFETCLLSQISEDSIIVILTPDDTHEAVLLELSKHLRNAKIIYAHGYSVVNNHLSEKFKNFSHLLLAPKAIASAVRNHYLTKAPLAAAVSYEFSNAVEVDKLIIKKLARDIGVNNLFDCTFEQETNADLFSEQSLLCSTLPYVANMSFKKLREKNIPAEIAYLECWFEIKLIADAMIKMGPENFFDLISPNALIGSEEGKNQLLHENFQESLSKLYDNIENGKFQKDCSETDIQNVKMKVKDFWKNQELTKTHNALKDQLYAH